MNLKMIHLRSLPSLGLAGLAMLALGGRADAQIFVRNTTDVPNQGSAQNFSENIDFADVDLDGDFDAAIAKGGDQGNIQDEIWINNGGAQAGTLGTFSDQTNARFPAIARDGRDIEFVDFDADGDFDLYISNTSTNGNQTNQWFVNDGGKQGGSVGFYTDETAARWVNLAGAGSSIAPTQLIGGGFIDWSCDCDFGDLDNDGDMDLVHSTYGGNFNGQVPTRIFLNDGDGFFEEFNPSGHQLSGSAIQQGDPGLWCEGDMTSNTNDTNGDECDIATNTLDIDLGDIDGDFDLDILHGDRDSSTRFFYNRLEENGGTPADLGFRDMTNFVYGLISPWAPGTGHYEQEMGDFDGDNDLDLYGLNWNAGGFGGLTDIVAENVGGRFDNSVDLGSSSTDDNEGDFGDYDNDGDLDLYIANFSGNDRLYQNDGNGNYTFIAGGPGGSGLNNNGIGNTSLDADWCDVDEDGDYDVFSAQDDFDPVLYWENTTQTPDTTAPRVAPVESLGNTNAGINGSPNRPVRTHVYDNAPYYITWYNPTELVLFVDGNEIDRRVATSVGGQVFRGVIPSNLVGNVQYRFESQDQYANLGVSAVQSYTASAGAFTKEVVYGTGTTSGLTGQEPEVHARALLTGDKPFYCLLDSKGMPQFYLWVVSLGSIAPTADPVLGSINIDLSQIAVQRLGATDAAGFAVRKESIPAFITGGFSVFVQGFFLETATPLSFSASKGIEVPVH